MLRELNKDDINLHTTFSPIRSLILLDDDKWKEFLDDKSAAKLLAIESLFAINEIFPNGMNSWKYELGRFFADLDTFQVSISFLTSISSNKKLNVLLNDFRMSIQNFMVFMEAKSYYSAFQEFRKMLEGILWMNFLKDGIEDIPDKITEWSYQAMLKEIDLEFGEMYRYLNKLFHYKSDSPNFNINRIYRQDDYLYDILKRITSLSYKYTDFVSKVLDSFPNNKSVNRYKCLITTLKEARDSYDLRNYPTKKTGGLIFMGALKQEEFAKLLLKYAATRTAVFAEEYISGIINLFNEGFYEYSELGPSVSLSYYYLSKYDSSFKTYANTISEELINLSHRSQQVVKKSIWSKLLNSQKSYINLILDTIKFLLKKEISLSGDLTLAILRSILEDIIINIGSGKYTPFPLLVYMASVLKVEYSVDLPTEIKTLSRYSHILSNNTLEYSRLQFIEEKKEGEGEIKEDKGNEFKKTLRKLLKLIMTL